MRFLRLDVCRLCPKQKKMFDTCWVEVPVTLAAESYSETLLQLRKVTGLESQFLVTSIDATHACCNAR